ncbi:hypothetical protein NLG97_g349 [Lecanicillium saksenae]|uniref:Uncharacterized protein n=1 Tax=Lecanicillium saksenae TaxID=468837 RepID=A0ACC1R7G5_9HYPO|nr:hypothetical protein NLG97_g349 [Lecanicillium saksenae]
MASSSSISEQQSVSNVQNRKRRNTYDTTHDSPPAKRIKSISAARITSNFPPQFWDKLSKVWLTPRALREKDRRNGIQPPAIASAVVRATPTSLARFARRGGPDLRHLRGYPEPKHAARMSSNRSSTPSNRRTPSTKATSVSSRAKRSSAYDKDFEQNLIDHDIYPEGFEHTDGRSTPEPNNLDDIVEGLAHPRASLSPSQFSVSAFKSFRVANSRVISEGKVMADILPTIRGNSEIPNEGNLPFANLESITNGTTVDAVPDWYDGSHVKEISKTTYGEEKQSYDGNAHAFSATYHDGTLKMYTHHVSAPTAEGGQPEYHMTQLRTFGMTDTRETFIAGATAIRNARDLAQKSRETVIRAANARASQIVQVGGTESTAELHKHNNAPVATEYSVESAWKDAHDDLQQRIADTCVEVCENAGVAPTTPQYRSSSDESQEHDEDFDTDDLSMSFVSNCRSLGTDIKRPKRARESLSSPTQGSRRYMDRNDAKEVYKYHGKVLIPRFNLRAPNIDGKPVLNVDSLRVILTFNIAYDTSVFSLGRHRIQLTGCYQLLCYTGARPAQLVDGERKGPKDGSREILFGQKVIQEVESDSSSDQTLDKQSQELNKMLLQETIKRGRPKALCYEDILLMLVRHPATGKPVLAMAIKFIHHKGADNKPKPTIFFFTPTRKLIFDAIMVIVALALHDHAFDAPSLTDAYSLLSKDVWGPKDCMPIRWKKDKLKVPVFRRIYGTTLSENEAMLYSKLNYDMGRQSLESGHEKAWTPRFARRGAANAANGDAPDAVRDQMMRHDPQFATFFNAYLNENANFDLQNAFLEDEKQNQLFRMFAHVSFTRDPRAVRDMVPENVWANQLPDPEIVKLEEERATLKQGSYRVDGSEHEERIRALTDEIRNRKTQRDRTTVKEYREYYFYNRPTWDIEAQARGEVDEEYEQPAIDLVIPERARLAEILCLQPDGWTDEELFKHRVETIDLMVALCDKKETGKTRRAQRPARIGTAVKQESPESDASSELDFGSDPFPLLMETTQCPDCIGDEQLPVEARKFKYCRPPVLNDHFDDEHLARRETAERRGEAIWCGHPKCRQEKFVHVDHFRSHVEQVHGVSLRTSDQVAKRRQRQAERREKARRGRQQKRISRVAVAAA